MILVWLTFIPLVAGILAWIAAKWSKELSRWVAVLFLTGELAITVAIWLSFTPTIYPDGTDVWLADIKTAWIPQLGIGFHLAMDGLSLLMVMLTVFLGIASVVCSWSEIQERVGFFHFCLLACLSGIIGVFLAVDLFLFYVFWEAMLVPMYILIAVWGHEHRIYAAWKFFIFTQGGGLFMLASILGLYFIHGQATGTYTFDYFQLLGTPLVGSTATWLMLGFFVAFVVKLPVVPLHTWLPDAHTEAPTAGSVILAGLLLKTGGYGLLRFILPLFPTAALPFVPIAMVLGVIGIIYGAVTAFGQTDLKRLVAYTSISHMGFVLLGIFAWNQLGIQGAIVAMLAHGISTGALFILVGLIQERIHSRDMQMMGGFWRVAPAMGGVAMVFALASLGLPGLGNFVGEFLALLGAFAASPILAVLGATGMALSVVYSTWIMYRAFFGAPKLERLADLNAREGALLAVMVALIVWLGLFPNPVLNTSESAVNAIQARGGKVSVALQRVSLNLESGDNRGTTSPSPCPSPSGRGDYSPHLVGSLSLWERVGVRVPFHASERNRATRLSKPPVLRQSLQPEGSTRYPSAQTPSVAAGTVAEK